jgi:predicted N-acyltransferase
MRTASVPPSKSTVRYHATVFSSIRDVDWDEWNQLRDLKRQPAMDPRFVLAVENSMTDARCRSVLIRDENRHLVAAACLCSIRIDGALLAEGRSRRVAAVISRIVPPLVHVRIVLCGLPVSIGASHLCFAPDADRAEALRALDQAVVEFAKKERAVCIVFKEFDAEESRALQPLEALGYRRAESLPMNCVAADYRTFDEYVARVNAMRRRNIIRSRKKFAAAGLRVEQRLGGEGIADLYTDEVHRLYEAVLARADVRFESLPAEFFRELARQLPQQTVFTLVYQQNRIVGFAASLFTEDLFEQMFVGLDYDLNPQCDLYFNLFFEALDGAFARGPREIYVGQTSDEFKHQKLSAYQFPLSIYVKGGNPVSRAVIKLAFHSFFPARPLRAQTSTKQPSSNAIEPPA